MNKFLKATAAAAALVFAAASHASLMIDDFSQGQAKLQDNVSSDGFLSNTSVFSSSIIGGYRDLLVNKVGNSANDAGVDPFNPQGDGVSIGVSSGALRFSQDTGQNGYAIVRWDGAHYDGFSTIDATGLGGLNFAGQAIGFSLTVLSLDAGFPFTLRAYSDASNYTTLTLVAGGLGTFVIPFSLFSSMGVVTGTGADFSNIGALEAIINTGGAVKDVDLQIDLVSSVPEPATLALVGLTLVAAGGAMRRRRNNG